MKRRTLFFAVLSIVIITSVCNAQSSTWGKQNNCPDTGRANGDPKHPNNPLLNVVKNKYENAKSPKKMELDEIRKLWQPAHWDINQDRAPLDTLEGSSIQITGFFVQLPESKSGNKRPNPKPGSAESCNCELTEASQMDNHCVMGETPDLDEASSITAEITPRVRSLHKHWDVQTLRKLTKDQTKVRLTGWLMLDTWHIDHNPLPRATNWELHPITKIEIDDGNGGWSELK